jgi:hypothetical protein
MPWRYKGKRRYISSNLDLGNIWRWVVNFKLLSLYSTEKVSVSIAHEARWAPEPVWTLSKREKSAGNRTRNVQPVAIQNIIKKQKEKMKIRCQLHIHIAVHCKLYKSHNSGHHPTSCLLFKTAFWTLVSVHVCRWNLLMRQTLTLSIGNNWAGSTWRRRQVPVSETLF